MHKRYGVQLTGEQRKRCLELVRSGVAHARSLQHAQMLLQADVGPEGPGRTDHAIAEALGVTTVTVAQVRKVLVTEGLDAALSHYRGPRREYRCKLDGHQEAHLLALAQSAAPAGHRRWSLRLLASRMVELEYVDTLSYQTVRSVLKRGHCSLGVACDG